MFIIGIAGGSGSGKTTAAKKLIDNIPESRVSIISQDAYYKDSSHLPMSERKKINFDHPSSVEFELLIQHLHLLRNGQSVEMPIYSYLTCTRQKETITVAPASVVIIEGIFVLAQKELRDLMDLKVFVDAPADNRFIRILNRDRLERGRNVASKKYADIILPQGGRNEIAIDVLRSKISQKIQ